MGAHTFDRGGQPDGTLMVCLDRFYGDEYVMIDLVDNVTCAYLTPEQARAVAADLIEHADRLAEMQ